MKRFNMNHGRSNIFFRSATTPHMVGVLNRILLALVSVFGYLFGSAAQQ